MNVFSPKQQQEIQGALKRLKNEFSLVQGALLVAPDGLMIAHAIEDENAAERVAAMSAAMHALGEKLGDLLKLGTNSICCLQRSYGRLYLISIKDSCLAVVASSTMERHQLTRAAKELESLI